MSGAALTAEQLTQLNAKFEKASPPEIVRWAVETFRPDVALTSSFGVKSAALIHMAIQVDPRISIRFIDTGFLFPETLRFVEALEARFHLNVATYRTTMDVERFKREHADLPVEHPDYCCGDYKVEATQRALQGLRGWITGISRGDSSTRAATHFVEVLNTGLTKIAPLAAWSPNELHAYMTAHNLPYHPLWDQGFTSVGCYPCTQKPTDPNDPRSGRWAGEDKTECGIHDIGKSKPTSR